tara:strand:- start:4384 stop:4962 length:579 start_codon:yes stop_codon:yes gene_type:complete
MPYIGLRPPTSPVDSSDIASGAVANTDLAVGAVTTHSIAAGAIDAGDIGTGGVSANTQLATGVVTAHATAADIAKTDVPQSFTVAQRGSISALGVQTSTVTLNMNTSNYFSLTANGNITIANPTNLTAGQAGAIIVTANGNYTTSFGSQWRFASGTAPTLSTTAGKVDRLDYVVQSSNTIHTIATIDLLGTA